MCYCVSLFFFFSSRRRHTRCSRDWSSDVCSSDLHGDRQPDELDPHRQGAQAREAARRAASKLGRSEEHTSELQSRLHLVCRLLLEKKKKQFTRLAPRPHVVPYVHSDV